MAAADAQEVQAVRDGPPVRGEDQLHPPIQCVFAAFRGSPMKRAKLRGLKRNAAVVLGNVGTVEDVPVLEQARDDPERLVREHAAWALARLGAR